MSESHKNIKVINLNEFDNFLNTAQQKGGFNAPSNTPKDDEESTIDINSNNGKIEDAADLTDDSVSESSEVTASIKGMEDEEVIIDEENDVKNDDDTESTISTVSTTQMLGGDPLFLVLSEYLVNKKGDNIVTVLDKLNDNIAKLIALHEAK